MKNKKLKKRITMLVLVITLVSCLVLYTKVTTKAELDEKTIYVTANEIPPRSLITEDDIKEIKLPARSIPNGVQTKKKDIVGKWTAQGYGLSANSFVYKDKIVEQSQLPDAALLELEDGEVGIPLLVDLETSYANSIIPNTKLDLNFRTSVSQGDQQKVLLGELVKNARVIAVKDSQATNVFTIEGDKNNKENTKDVSRANSSNLAKIYIFAVPAELEQIVNKAKYIGEVYPVATGHTYDQNAEVVIPQNEVIEYLNSVSYKGDIEVNKDKSFSID
ncbi:hypothetical protein [Lysinibacillus sphaericus]|uniref:hypothetical protein n=1 Tax=Lysinibacillus sphaericus TaxID=1421 RepID=UPI000C1861C3|nr:hypothetical protein [Lysinibacillus sphaericus]PIJ95817.1 hypothetical protein CTN02_21895 [Lysinibacillus sphaericus]